MQIYAVVGMSGSGKTIVTDYFESLGYKRLNFGTITYKLMEEANIIRTKDGKSEKEFRENLRKEYGRECYAKFLEEEIKKYYDTNNIVLDGLYSWEEYNYLINIFPNLKLIAVVTDKELRYERVSKRKERSFDKESIIYRDIAEIENISKGGPIAYADYFILNNKKIEDIYKRIDEIIEGR